MSACALSTRLTPLRPPDWPGAATVLAATLLITGCGALAPPPLQAELPAAWRHTPAQPGTPAPDLTQWWRAFDDALLERLVPELLAQNLGIAQARLRVRQAGKLAQRNAGNFLPQLAASFRPSQDAAAKDTFFRSSLEASWQVSFFGERESADRIARGRIGQAQAESEAAQATAVAELARQVLLLRAAQQEAVTLERLRVIDAGLLERARVRREQRMGSRADERTAAERLAETEAQAEAPRLAAELATLAIAALLGRSTSDPAWLAAAPAVLPADFAVGELPSDLLRTRADVRAAEAAVQQAAGEAGLARAELFPRIAVGANIVWSQNLTHNERAGSDSVVGIGPIIDFPLFDWGQRRARSDELNLALEAAVIAWRQTVVDAYAEAESALAALAQARRRSRVLAEARTRAEQAAAETATLQRTGLAADGERLLAERRVAEAAQADSAQRYAAALAAVQVYKALGGASPFAGARSATPEGRR